MTTEPDAQTRWRDALFSTSSADRAATAAAVAALYKAAGIPPPRYYCWFDSPCAGAWAIALLLEPRDRNWNALVGSARRRRDARERLERVQTQLLAQASQGDIAGAIAAFGQPLSPPLILDGIPPKTLHSDLLNARMDAHGDVSALFSQPLDGPLQKAEDSLWGNAGVLSSGLFCHSVETLVSNSFYSGYSFMQMAMDEAATSERTPPPLLAAAWAIARSVGPWWAWMNAAVLSEHPVELHVDGEGRPHSPDGPAVTYKDGWRVFAWEGYAMPEQWILDPASVPKSDLRNCPASFRKRAADIGSTGPKPSSRPRKSELFASELPRDRNARAQYLRNHAGGQLSRFDRYLAGEHQQVWKELVDAGEDVRQDALAADALAVAYETMERVNQNVRTLVERLNGLSYRFSARQPHQPPGKRTWKELQQLERLVGPLPLSLRAFYDVVGAVDLIGRHRGLIPRDSSIPPDPLVVYGVEDAVQEAESMEDEESREITIAPDDLHKEDMSGGDPYVIAVPDARADAIVLNERHDLLFVDYLRLACRLGGFPGYEGVDRDLPAELDRLRAGLLEF